LTQRRPLDALAIATMLVLAMVWGLQQVAIKLAAPAVSPLLQAAVRSSVATLLLLAWATARRIPLWQRDRTLAPGLAAGLLFAAEFALIYGGLAYTSAGRMVVFVYLAPCVTALGLSWLVPGERLSLAQWSGVALAFAGVAVAFADDSAGPHAYIGDLCGIAAAILWAATTVLIRATRLGRASATKVLFYQLATSAAVLSGAALITHTTGFGQVTPLVIASLAYQSIAVAFASYLAWFWLLTRYLAGRLAVFSFLTPLFGVAFGVMLLGEALTLRFAAAAVLVGAGIALVNLVAAPRAAMRGETS
jgi:drug/metabolite transporter (DMT)-like permease